MAAIHGAELKGEPDSQSEEVPLFGDVSSYEGMSMEDREELTQKMMGKHKAWVENNPI